MTVVTIGSKEIVEQITKQLNKLVDVIKLVDLYENAHIEKELMLIKLRAIGAEQREELKRLSDIFQGKIVDTTESSYTIELTGSGVQLDDFISAAGSSACFGVGEVRSVGAFKRNKSVEGLK